MGHLQLITSVSEINHLNKIVGFLDTKSEAEFVPIPC
jgi:hypothetical protein